MTDYVSSIGTIRRSQALSWLGWTRIEIEQAAGVHVPRHNKYRPRVTVATAAGMAAAYDLLWDQTPPPKPQRHEIRNWALRLGWAPPMAWDEPDIDDPSAIPQGLEFIRPLSIHQQVVELLEIGCSVTELPGRVGARNLNAIIGAIRDPQLKAELRRRAS